MRRLALLVRLAPLLQRELVHGFGQQVQAVQEVLELALVGVAPLQPGPVRSPLQLAQQLRRSRHRHRPPAAAATTAAATAAAAAAGLLGGVR